MQIQMNLSSASFSLKYHPLQHADCIKKLQSPVTYRSKSKRYSIKCSQNSFYPTNKSRSKYSASVRLQDGYASKSEDDNNSMGFQDNILKKFNALYRFTRPYSLMGTIIGITSISLLPLQTFADLTPKFFIGLLKGLVPTIFMYIYQNGINQVYDVEIDKINKPNLPLASGDISMGAGIAIVSISLLMSFAMGIMFQSPPILWALFIIFLLATAYSVDLPFLRWKRNSFLTAFYLLTVRGFVFPFAYFIHIQKCVLGRPVVITRQLMFTSAFMCCLSVVIALLKDIPDVDGDKEFGIQNITILLGKERVFWLCVYMLLIAYGVAVIVGASSSSLLGKLVSIISHSTLASFMWHRARTVDLSDNVSSQSFYMFIWKLYFAENLLIHFLR